jgi:hypothetical protein
VQLDELLGQREPEPGPLVPARVIRPRLVERLEDRRLLVLGDPNPRAMSPVRAMTPLPFA